MKILILPIKIDEFNRFVSFYVDSKEQKLISINFEQNFDDLTNLKNTILKLTSNKNNEEIYYLDGFTDSDDKTTYFFAIDVKKINPDTILKINPDDLLEIKVNEFNEVRDLNTQFAVLKTMFIILKK